MSALTGELFNQLHLELENFIMNKVKDKVIAQDILQDVFVKIHLKVNTVKDPSKVNSWIYQLTRNTIYDYYRKQVVNAVNIDSFDHLTEPNIQTQQGLENCVLPFIAKLPQKYQEALMLTDIKGMSQTEVASHLNISYSAAKSRVQRARQKLKSLLTECCHIDADVYGNILSFSRNKCGVGGC
jgi:RNA polymerase sigma-70 factor (ECF subfamily)